MKQYKKLLVWSAHFLWRSSKLDVIGFLVVMSVQVAAEVLQLWVAAQVIVEISRVLQHQGEPDRVLWLVAASLVLMITDKIAWQLLSLFERRLYLSCSAYTYMLFNSQLAKLSVQQHNDSDIRQMIDRIEYEGYAWKPINFSMELFYTLHAFLRFVVSSVVIITLLPLVVLLLIIGVIPMVIVQQRSGDAGWGIWGDIGDGSRIFWGISRILRKKESIEEILPQGSADFLLDRAHATIRNYTTKATKVRMKYTKYEILSGIFEMTMAAIGYMWLVFKAIAGVITLERFIFVSSLIWQTLSSVRLVATSIGRALQIVPFMKDFITLSEMTNSLSRQDNEVKIGNQPFTIEFRQVTFAYPHQSKPQLDNVSFTIQPGEHIALVGENGAGKTTLIKLLLRFYDPQKGAIYINGHDIKTINLESYYQQIGTLFQVFTRYPLSFRENITLSQKTDLDHYNRALDISGADSVKGNFPDDVMLGADFKNGLDLSGGQWQKVAIARNIYTGGWLYILDEPTSAIDALAEQRIFNKLYSELSDKTLITVSHRFNTVRKADRIIVLDQGRVIETGSHDELCAKNTMYKKLFTAQAEGYR